jgi:hypothetical protein
MGAFAEITIIDYRSLFANQGKQTSVSCFHLKQTNGSSLFPFSVCSKQTELAVSVSFVFCVYIYIQRSAYRQHYSVKVITLRYIFELLRNASPLTGKVAVLLFFALGS